MKNNRICIKIINKPVRIITAFFIMAVIGLSLLTAKTFSEETFSISGTVRTSFEGDIYIGLCTMEDWQRINEKFPSPPRFQVIKMNNDQPKPAEIPFQFKGIKKGNYCIVAHQDINKNGEIDRLVGGKLSEPRGLYKVPDLGWPSWGEINFDLNQDLTGVQIMITEMLYKKIE